MLGVPGEDTPPDGEDQTHASSSDVTLEPAAFLRENRDPDLIWRKYCGFLDLSTDDFSEIQEQLLLEQIDLVHASPLGRRLLRGTVPHSVAEFRANVPLTTYADYVSFLHPGQDDSLDEKPVVWAQTTGAQADFKWVPYTRRGFERVLDNLMAGFILATASHPGDVNVWQGDTILFNTPERPYFSGLLAFAMVDRFGFRGVLDPETSERLDFKERIRLGFKEALGHKIRIIVSMTSVLTKVGTDFSEQAKNSDRKLDRRHITPRALFRLLKAGVKSKLLNRQILPKDLWPATAIIGWGMDTRFFRDQVTHYWGRSPYEIYGCTEGGVMAMQSWDKKGLIFNPYANFYEFIPLEESLKNRGDNRDQLETVLLNETKPGQIYELVITNFYGMAFTRYRVGHLVQVLPKNDEASENELPQFAFIGRADDRIDLAGFTRIDEKSIWDSINLTGFQVEAWTVRKEFEDDIPTLHVYIELKQPESHEMVTEQLDKKLKELDPFYSDLESMLEIKPLRVTVLNPGSFDRLYENRRQAGFELGRRAPARMNAADEDIADLLKASNEEG